MQSNVKLFKTNKSFFYLTSGASRKKPQQRLTNGLAKERLDNRAMNICNAIGLWNKG